MLKFHKKPECILLFILLAFAFVKSAGADCSSHDPNADFPKKTAQDQENWGGYVKVNIITEKDVYQAEIEKELYDSFISPPHALILQFNIQISKTADPVFFIAKHPICGGAGLVIEHSDPNGKITRQSIPYKKWWHSRGKWINITSLPPPENFRTEYNRYRLPEIHFEIEISPITAVFDFSKPGIYKISYQHPWEDMKNTNMKFGSDTKIIAMVLPERKKELNSIYEKDPKLALASYKFRHPPTSWKTKNIIRAGNLGIIDQAIHIGCRRDKILLLLGSPDIVGINKTSTRNESWHYNTGPVSGYYLKFKNDFLVAKGHSCDDPNP